MTVSPQDLTPWSISKGQVAQDCSLRFNLKYIKRERGQKIERPEGRIGSAAHLFLERCLKGEDYKSAFMKSSIDEKLTREESLELATFKDPVLRFVKRFNAWRKKMGVGDDSFFIEKEVSFSRDKVPTGFWDTDTFFRSKWDIGAIVEKGTGKHVVIIDHKTGTPPAAGDPDPLGKYRDQLWSYIASAYIEFPDLAGVQTAIHWMREDDPKHSIMWGQAMSKDRIVAEILPWFWKYFAEATDKGCGTPTPKKGWYCDFCEYRYKCPLFR